MKITLWVVLLSGAMLAGGCARGRNEGTTAAATRLRLDFISDFEFRGEGEPFNRGGSNAVTELSGLAYDAEARELVAVADDGEPARLYRFGVELEGGVIRVAARREVVIRGATGDKVTPAVDVEGVAVVRDGYYVAVEGREKTSADGTAFRPTCGLLHVDAGGRIVGEIELPPRYRARVRRDNVGVSGPRDNGSLESVALSPDGTAMFTAVQIPLIEDDLPRDASRGGVVRFLRLRGAGETFVADGEYAYVLDPQPPPTVTGPDGVRVKDKNNGLVELVALTTTRLLVMEKGVVAGRPPGGTSVRIYDVDLAGAADVSAVAGFSEAGAAATLRRAVRKRLVLNLDDVASRFKTPTVANFEGMTLGPRYAGRPTLILVSDDNGNDTRSVGRTVFAAFHVDGLAE
jgi:hypothetical protein